MYKINGADFCEQVYNLGVSYNRMIMLTGTPNKHTNNLEQKGLTVFKKPYNIIELVDTINMKVELYKQQNW